VLAQRLIRLLCPHCKKAVKANETECELMSIPYEQAPEIYHPVGCDKCRGLGYSGRSGLYELVMIDEEMQTMIHQGEAEQVMQQHARKSSDSLRQDGYRRVLKGETSLEEVLRVS
jgi:general secretion pathway protein E